MKTEAAVDQGQGLQRRGGDLASGSGDRGIRTVEGTEQPGFHGACVLMIDGTAAGRFVELLLRVVSRHVVDGVTIEPESGAPHLQVQLSRNGQDGVPNRLCLEAARRKPPEVARVLIDLGELGHVTARLPVGHRHHDLFVEGLPAPAQHLDAPGQPVEQLRMCGARSVEAEIVGSRDQPGPEMVVPDPVCQDPGGQRILVMRNPAGPAPAVSPTRARRAGVRRVERDRPGRSGCPGKRPSRASSDSPAPAGGSAPWAGS